MKCGYYMTENQFKAGFLMMKGNRVVKTKGLIFYFYYDEDLKISLYEYKKLVYEESAK